MEKKEKIDLYKRALFNWGEDAQVNMVHEECGELTTALARFKRGRSTPEEVLTELADVSIMCEQIGTLFGYANFEAEKERKLERLKKRLDDYEEKLRTNGEGT